MTTTDTSLAGTAMPIADAESRAGIASRLDETLFVEAGAGTGKTTALVSRVVALVESGVPMRSIAAITFTEAAAAELRDRVRTELERRARESDSAAIRTALEQVDDAAISTLHAFAQRILAEHPLEAGLPPTIDVLDEIEADILFEERWDAFVDELLDDPTAETILLRAFAATLSGFEGLRSLATALHDDRDRFGAEDLSADRPPMPIDAGPVIDKLAAAVAYAPQCAISADLLLEHLVCCEAELERLRAAGDELSVLEILVNGPRWNSNRGQAPNWPGVPVDVVRKAFTDAEAARGELIAAICADVLAHLLRRLMRFTVESARERRASGRLDFHDLLVEARDLLRARPDVRRALRQRFSHLLVDEFQDTDPIQVELAVLIAADEDEVAGVQSGWRGVRVEPGRLFFVGDAKQSIYRFRRADIALFLEVQAAVADDVLTLGTNFRSVPGLLDWVNALFGVLIGAGAPGAQAAYEPLDAHRAAGDRAVPVVLIGGPVDEPLARVREAEGADIAGTIVRAVEQEGWRVSDKNAPGGERPARYSDVAILLPTRTSLPQLEAAFDDIDLPYRVETASLVWDTQAVRDLLAVVRAIDDPNDEVALLAALRAPALGCSDADLVEFRQAGGRWDLRAPCPEALGRHPVGQAIEILRGLHDRRWWEGVAALVDRVVRELHFHHLALVHRRSRDHWRRLRFVVDQARAFEEAGGTTLRGFAAWAARQATDAARVREPSLPEEDDDAVQILTVHGAKGLEFPIVVVTGLNRVGTAPAPAVLWDGDTVEARLTTRFRTPGYAALEVDERGLERHEQIRLLYVAMTRARDHLVVSVHRKASGECHAKQIADAAAAFPELWRQLDAHPFRMLPSPAGRPPIVPRDLLAQRQRWAAAREHDIAAGRTAPVRAATAIASQAGDRKDEPDVAAAPWRRGRAGTARGRAVHAVLQTVDLATGSGVDAAAQAQAAAEGIDDFAADVAAFARTALGSTSIRAAVQSGRLWRELYVAAPVGPTLVEGFIDLAYDPGDGRGLVIVDYKTDSIAADGADAAVVRYRLQLAAYALVLEELGQPVSRAVLLFVSGGRATEREIVDLPAAVAEVRTLVGG